MQNQMAVLVMGRTHEGDGTEVRRPSTDVVTRTIPIMLAARARFSRAWPLQELPVSPDFQNALRGSTTPGILLRSRGPLNLFSP
jgi:hypothetical protein